MHYSTVMLRYFSIFPALWPMRQDGEKPLILCQGDGVYFYAKHFKRTLLFAFGDKGMLIKSPPEHFGWPNKKQLRNSNLWQLRQTQPAMISRLF